MKHLSTLRLIIILNLLLGYQLTIQGQTNPPENLFVVPTGMATWDAIENEDFQFYKIFLNEVYIADIDSNLYQLGNNDEELISGETYLFEVAALYNSGMSDKNSFEFTYFPCDSFPPHSELTGYEENNMLYFVWDQVEEYLDDIYVGTNFYFEDEFIEFIPKPDTFLIVNSSGPGFYDYCFRRAFTYDNGIHIWESCIGESCIQDLGYPWSCNPPNNLEAEPSYDYVYAILTWNTPDDANEPGNEILGYNVYRDGERINNNIVTDTIYLDYVFQGFYCYEITAVYPNCDESDPSNESCVDLIDFINTIETFANISPNPATDQVKIISESIVNSLRILNSNGQVCYELKKINNTHIELNTDSFKPGVYFVEIISNNSIKTKKLIIQK